MTTMKSAGRKKTSATVPLDELQRLVSRQQPHAIEAEVALLSSMILDGQITGDVLQVLRGPDDFYKPAHGAIYQALVDLYEKAIPADLVHLNQRLRDQEVLDSVGGVDYLIELAEAVQNPGGAVHHAKIVRDKAVLRSLLEALGRCYFEAHHSSEPIAKVIDAAERAIFEVAAQRDEAAETVTTEQLMAETLAHLEAQDGRTVTGIETGYYELDDMLGGLQPGDMVILAARPSMGKAQPLTARVLTPTGFRPMGAIRVGDRIIGSDGRPTRVTGVFPQGHKPCYRVVFADGASTLCCGEHLWETVTRDELRFGRGPSVKSTDQIRASLRRADNGGPNHHVRWVRPVEFDAPSGHRPIDPYLLGLWLGDGCGGKRSSVVISNPEPDLQERIRDAVPDSCVATVADDQITVRVKKRRRSHSQSAMRHGLEALGLGDLLQHDRFIPKAYLIAPVPVRRQLLRGLLDSDGHVYVNGTGVEFTTTSPQLARDVRFLAWSLGGWASEVVRTTRYRYKGELRPGRPSHRIVIAFHDGFVPVSSSKHLSRWRGRRRGFGRAIVSIEDAGEHECQCIKVAATDQLYVTDDFIVTHNTALALSMAEHMALRCQQPVGFFSLEMSRQQLGHRLLSSVGKVNSQRIRRNMFNGEDFERLHTAADQIAKAPLVVDDTTSLSVLRLRAKARRLAGRYGLQAIFVDYLQLLTSHGAESRQQEVSEISRGLKALARELKVPVVCLSQLNRQAESRHNHRPQLSDLRESGSLEQDADVVMLLHREAYYHKDDREWEDQNPEKVNQAELIVAKQRNGPTGTVPLHFQSDLTRFENAARR